METRYPHFISEHNILECLFYRTRNGTSPRLIYAIKNGLFDNCHLLLQNDEFVNAFNVKRQSLLHIAASKGYIQICKLLIDKKANLEYRDSEGFTPFMIAALNNKQNVCKLLLEYDSNINARDDNRDTALMIAVLHKNVKLVDFLLDLNIDINAQNRNGETALLYASRFCNTFEGMKIFIILLSCNVNVNHKDCLNNSALSNAVQCNNIQAVLLLINKKADTKIFIDFKTFNGKTLFNIVYRNNNLDLAVLLIRYIKLEIIKSTNKQGITAVNLWAILNNNNTQSSIYEDIVRNEETLTLYDHIFNTELS